MRIGNVIRKLRHERNLTIREVSANTNLTKSLISQIETDKANPSISSLIAIAKALNVPVGSFFTTLEQPPGVVVKPDKRSVIKTKSGVTLYLLTPNLDNRRVEFLYCVYEDESSTEKMYSHEGEEYGLVLEGCLEVVTEQHTYRVEAGDSITVDSSKPHLTRNIHPGRTTAIWVNCPPTF